MANPFEKIFNKAPLRNHLSPAVHVGYSQFGPTLTLDGTLSAADNIIFINNISLSLLKKSNGRLYAFSWFAFLPHRLDRNRDPESNLKMPAKFLVSPNAPYPYHIIFYDQDHYITMKPILKFIRQNWEEILEQAPQAAAQTHVKLFETFVQQDSVKKAAGDLNQFCYWEAGEYLLGISLVTEEQRVLSETKKLFSLSALDVEGLKKNTPMIVTDLCRQPGVNYFSVEAQMKDKN